MFKKISAFIAALTITASAAGTLPINNTITANAASDGKNTDRQHLGKR